jgi:hypothetical protein
MYQQRETSSRMSGDSEQFLTPRESKNMYNAGAAADMIKVPRVCASTKVLVLHCSMVRTLFLRPYLRRARQAPVCRQDSVSMTRITRWGTLACYNTTIRYSRPFHPRWQSLNVYQETRVHHRRRPNTTNSHGEAAIAKAAKRKYRWRIAISR